MKCQHEIRPASTVGGDIMLAAAVVCAKPVTEYRQCGRGCKHEIGYCPEHGGIERATEEMGAHHKTHDAPKIAFEVTEMKPMELLTAPPLGAQTARVSFGGENPAQVDTAKGMRMEVRAEAFDMTTMPAGTCILTATDLPLRDTAFVVGFIDTTDGTFTGAGVFSEETPTMGVKFFPFTIMCGSGRDFQEGLDGLRARFTAPFDVANAWVLRALDDRGKKTLGLTS